MQECALHQVRVPATTPRPRNAWALLDELLAGGYSRTFLGRALGSKVATARAVCAACPVAEECRAYALAVPGFKGVWGGLSEHERSLRRHQAVVPDVEVGIEAPPPMPGPATSTPGTLLAHLEELARHQGQWAQLARSC
jgi:hypothetical protein